MNTFIFLIVALAILATLSAAHTMSDHSARAATLSGTNKGTNEIEKKLVRNLRYLHSNEGACNNGCSEDSDCNGFVGGPNPCHYCNQGNCSKDVPPPTPAPTSSNNGACGNSCQEDTDCEWVGGPNKCHYCVDFVCAEVKPACDTNKICTDDNDCDPDNSCVCHMGHYGLPPHCGEWKGE
jgi:hypothetical protein